MLGNELIDIRLNYDYFTQKAGGRITCDFTLNGVAHGTWYIVHGTWHMVHGAWHIAHSTWHVALHCMALPFHWHCMALPFLLIATSIWPVSLYRPSHIPSTYTHRIPSTLTHTQHTSNTYTHISNTDTHTPLGTPGAPAHRPWRQISSLGPAWQT